MATETTHAHDASAQPLACALSPVDQKTRLEEWRALRREGLIRESREGLVWTSLWRPGEDVRARLEAVIEAEKACCSFLTFELDDADGVVRVRTLFPQSVEGMLEAFIR